ncbi:MAG: ATP-binding protein [Melioribacteraceae bacterium]|nr:ATP-binding protein [Melioribacteraceae bacterium]
MKRKIYKVLKEWKDESNRRPLLIRGARQIGKSYIVNVFGKNEFNQLITLNFERNQEYKEIFSTNNPIEIVEKIILYTGKKVEQGKTLIFLDEIQECPKAIMALRYFYEDMPEQHIIGAGSLLEFTLQSEKFRMPVGRVQYLYMFPLSFGEFMNALGENILYSHILDLSNLEKLQTSLHKKLIEYIRKYFILGGMPAVINEYIESCDILKCQKIQNSIIDTYIDDFAKYTSKSKIKYLRKAFTSVSTMVGKKYVYANVDRSIKSRDLKDALELLERAGVVYRIKQTTSIGLPFEAGVKENFFKMLFIDIGLLHAINGIYSETVKEKDLTIIFKGAVAEQFVGQEIITLKNNFIKPAMYYWAREAKNSSAEIDYLIELNNNVIPIEIKSGTTGRMKSMKLFLESYNIKSGIKISQARYEDKTNIISVPFYGVESFFQSKN